MQQTTQAYKESMKKLLRNRSTMLVAIGEINADVQVQATGRTGYSGYAIHYVRPFYESNSIIFHNGSDMIYGTLEENFVKADGEKKFPPRSTETELCFDTGYVSNGLMKAEDTPEQVQYTLTQEVGETIDTPFTITIEFCDYAPSNIILAVWNGANYVSYTFANNTDMKISHTFHTLPEATDIYYLNIACYGATSDYRRLRIKSITFGEGVLIFSDIIEGAETNYHVSRINEDLPTADLNLNLINYDSRYDADNPDNPLSILDDSKQTIDVHFGYDVADNGNYEWVHGGKFLVDSWKSSQHRAEIVGKDRLQNNDELYIHNNNEMLSDGIHSTCADWILDICGYGSSVFESVIPVLFDADLWRMYIYFPVPSLTRKECLQLIANYACKTMYIDRDGVVNISSHSDSTKSMDLLNSLTYVYPQTTGGATITGNVLTTYRYLYAQVTDLLNGYKCNYPLEMPASNVYEFTPSDWGIVTNIRIDIYAENVLDEPPINIEKADIVDDMQVNKEELIRDVIVPYYKEIYQPIDDTPTGTNLFDLNNIEQGTISASGVPQDSTTRLRSIDYVVLEAGTYTLSLSGFQVSMLVYSMTESYISGESYSDWYNSPKTMTLNGKRKVKFVFRKSTNVELEPSDITNTMLEFGDTVTSFEFYRSSRQIWEDENVYGNEYGKYDLYVDLGQMYSNVKIDVDGREVTELLYADIVSVVIDVPYDGNPHLVTIDADCQTLYTSQNVSVAVNDSGKPLEWKNPLVATEARAEAIAEFVADYVASNVFYEYQYRGNPEYDSNDTILQENDFTSDMQAIITDHKIGFNGGLSGNITSRRNTEE